MTIGYRLGSKLSYSKRLAAQYGIGTYIKEYVHCLLNIGCRINLIELGTDNKQAEFSIKEEKGVRTFYIPYVQSRDFMTYNKSVCRLLRLYLEDSSDLVFHFHYQQSSSLLESLKQYFPLSRTILTIHYLYWSARLNGRLSDYEYIIRCKSHKRIKKKYQDVVDNCEYEKKFIQSVDRVVCLSEETYSLLKNLYSIDINRLTTIPNGLAPCKVSISIKKRNEIRDSNVISEEYQKHLKWKEKTKIAATPTVMFDGYELPEMFFQQIERLIFFTDLEVDSK